MLPFDEIARANPEYVDALYREYLRDPTAVDERWALVFAGFDLALRDGARAGGSVAELVHAYRELGHLVADLDPLGGSPREHPLLRLSELGFTERDLDRVVDWAPFKGGARGPLGELIAALRETYCGTLGVEYLSVADKGRRDWLQERMEPRRNHPDLSADERRAMLERLVIAEMFEQFLQARYPGQKRFSLEGGEALVPLLDALVEETARLEVAEVVLGMAHRGRLNVLAHVLEKPYEMIFAEFEGAPLPDDILGDGDVKYHLGYSKDRRTRAGAEVHLSLTSNPSHLESVNPVVEGIVRAKQAYREDRGRLSPDVPRRRLHRLRVLPAPRSQRAGRPDADAAGDVRADPQSPVGGRALHQAPGRGGRGGRGAAGGDAPGAPRGAGGGARPRAHGDAAPTGLCVRRRLARPRLGGRGLERRHARAGRPAAGHRRGAGAAARRLHAEPAREEAARRPARAHRARRGARLGRRGVARLWQPAAGGHARARQRPGHRARHVRPSSRRDLRPQGRATVGAAQPRPGRSGAARGRQQPAQRRGRARLRVRHVERRPAAAHGLGGAVRRFREQRAGDHRSVHRERRVQVAAHERARAPAAARLRGPGLRALERAARALPAALRRPEHPGDRADDAGADLSRAAAADPSPLPQAARGDVAQEPVAPPPGRVAAHRAHGRRLSADARRPAPAVGGAPPRDVRGQDLLRARRRATREAARRRGARPHRAALPVPHPRGARAGPASRLGARGLLGAGGAGQRGRVVVRAAAALAAAPARRPLLLHRPRRGRWRRDGLVPDPSGRGAGDPRAGPGALTWPSRSGSRRSASPSTRRRWCAG